MTDQVFELENFRGPMDLLLHLIREQELEITEIDLSHLCDQYLAAIAAMEAVDINVAGEFLVMASTLILIKSRKLLPHEEEIDLEEELDPGDELIQQLLEYRKYKTLSMELGRRAQERSLRTGRGMKELPPDAENELVEIDLWDLVGSYVRLMEELGLQRRFDTLRNEKPLRAFLRETLSALSSRNRWTLRELVLHGGGDEGSVFGFFLSLLELVKTRQIHILRDGREGEIAVELREDRDESRLSFLYDGPEGGGVAGTEPEADEPTPADIVPPPDPQAEAAAEADEGAMIEPLPPVDPAG
jgi:segregation and condensation protein A